MEKNIIVYYDKEADFLEVIFEKVAGYFIETEHDAVMEKVASDNGRVIGFSILNVSKVAAYKPMQVLLAQAA
jgi:uncharacterized protein YuzE